jgi:hypothetical protein
VTGSLQGSGVGRLCGDFAAGKWNSKWNIQHHTSLARSAGGVDGWRIPCHMSSCYLKRGGHRAWLADGSAKLCS